MAELVQLHELVAESHGGITQDEIHARFNVIYDWADRPSLTVSDAARARLMGLQRPMPVTLNLHEDGESWVANATSKGFERRVEGVAHRDCLNFISVQLYGMCLA
jgi:hypothetical protein